MPALIHSRTLVPPWRWTDDHAVWDELYRCEASHVF